MRNLSEIQSRVRRGGYGGNGCPDELIETPVLETIFSPCV